MAQSALQTLKTETDYQILNRQVELQLLQEKTRPFRLELATCEDKARIKHINKALADMDELSRRLQDELTYYDAKKRLLASWT